MRVRCDWAPGKEVVKAMKRRPSPAVLLKDAGERVQPLLRFWERKRYSLFILMFKRSVKHRTRVICNSGFILLVPNFFIIRDL